MACVAHLLSLKRNLSVSLRRVEIFFSEIFYVYLKLSYNFQDV